MRKNNLHIPSIAIAIAVLIVNLTLASALSLQADFLFMVFLGFPALLASLILAIVAMAKSDDKRPGLAALVASFLIFAALLSSGAVITLDAAALSVIPGGPHPQTLPEYIDYRF